MSFSKPGELFLKKKAYRINKNIDFQFHSNCTNSVFYLIDCISIYVCTCVDKSVHLFLIFLVKYKEMGVG